MRFEISIFRRTDISAKIQASTASAASAASTASTASTAFAVSAAFAVILHHTKNSGDGISNFIEGSNIRTVFINNDKIENVRNHAFVFNGRNRVDVIFNADDLSQTTYDSTVTEGEFTLVATSDKKMDKKSSKVNFTYNGENYSVSNGLSMGGKATFGSNRYISFTVDGPCTVTIAVRSSGTDTRTLTMVNEAGKTVGSYEAPSAVAVSSIDVTEAGTYSVGSAGSGMYVYMIIIEYFE